jgi:uncharacterized membrane protein
MDHTVWNTFQGRIFTLSHELETQSRFSHHADLILVLLAPLYILWDDVRMLIVSESVALALGAIPVYLLSLKLIKRRIPSLVVATSYLLNPAMQWTDIYDFHGVSFAIPFLLSAFYFAYTKNWKWFVVFVFLALITKEQISLFVAILGLITAFIFKNYKLGFTVFAVGVVWFISMIFVVIPYFSKGDVHWAMEWYSLDEVGSENESIMSLPVSLFQKYVLPQEYFSYYLLLIKPFGFLPLLGLPWLIMAGPELAINALSSNIWMRDIMFHYDSGITPALVISTIFGLYYLETGFKWFRLTKKYSTAAIYAASLFLLFASIRVNYHYSPLPTTPSCWCYMYNVTDNEREFSKILKTIPPDAIVAASGTVRAHVTHREHAHNLPVPVGMADYYAILTEERVYGSHRIIDYEVNLVRELEKSEEYVLVANFDKFYLFRRSDEIANQ